MKTAPFASTYSVNHKCLKKLQIKWHRFAEITYQMQTKKGKIQWELGKPGTKKGQLPLYLMTPHKFELGSIFKIMSASQLN